MNDFTMTRGERRATWALGSVFSLRMLGMFMVLPVLTTYGMSLAGASEALIGLAIGIDLHDCISPDIEVLNQNIFNKINRVGKDLVQTAKHLSAKYGVPIVNQRISY